MATYFTPGVYYENVDASPPGIAAIRTDIAAFIGISERGPLHLPTRLTSWKQFQSTFGNFQPNAYLPYSIKAFFENGGRVCYGIRVAAPAVSTTTSGPQPADGSASVVAAVTGFVPGAAVTLEQTTVANSAGVQPPARLSSVVDSVAGFAAGSVVRIIQAAMVSHRRVRSVDAAAKTLAWEEALDAAYVLNQPIKFETVHRSERLLQDVAPATRTLTWTRAIIPEFNVAQPVTCSTGVSTADGNLLDARSQPTLRVEASSPGGWGNQLQVHVSHNTGASTRTSAVPQPTGREGSYVESVVGFDPGSVVKVFQEHVPNPLETYRLVKAADQGELLLVWDSALDPSYNLAETISFETVEFGISVYLGGHLREVFDNLSLQPLHPRYVDKALEQRPSEFIFLKDLHSSTSYPGSFPDPGAWNLNRGLLELEGGRDGVAGLKVLDLTGDSSSSNKTGIRTLEDIDEVAIVALPDVLIQPSPGVEYLTPKPAAPDPCLPLPYAPPPAVPPAPLIVEAAPTFSLAQIFLVQQALVSHCESLRNRIAVLDSPWFSPRKVSIDVAEIQGWRRRFVSRYAALYFPWIVVEDPLQLRNQAVRAIPPSGHVTGVYARTDLEVGVHKAPANAPVLWAQDVALGVDSATQGVLNPLGVNCIRVFPGRGLLLYGARTLAEIGDTQWRFVNVRRLMMMIESAVQQSIQWTVFEPDSFPLRRALVVSISSFLEMLWRRGALVGASADDAFYVQCDERNNPPAIVDLGELIVEVGVAPTQPAEFVIFRVGRTNNTLEVTE